MNFHDVGRNTSVLEIGCGEGGNLLPFARLGCEVVGVDVCRARINEALSFFEREDAPGTFICDDVLNVEEYKAYFDIIICHDVMEHVPDKGAVLSQACRFLRKDGVCFVAFPAWPMPFGGHQQICKSRVLSKLPFIHLLPARAYHRLLACGESDEMVRELMSIKRTGITVEAFETIAATSRWEIMDRRLYLINPHYQIKYGLRPRLLPAFVASMPRLRNFFSTSCFYMLRPGKTQTAFILR